MRSKGRLSIRAWTWRVFVSCWFVYTVFWTPYLLREHFPAVALIENGSLNVKRYLGWTDDIFAGPRGGAYINNNPGASVTGAIPLIVLQPLLARVDRWNQTLPRPKPKPNDGELFWRTLDEGRAFYFLLVEFITVAGVMAPITAGTVAFLCRRLIQAGVPAAYAALSALLYGIATPVLFRTSQLNHNLLVCDAGFAALLVLWDPKEHPLGAGRAALAGLLAGYALLCDYSGVVVALVTTLYVWLRTSREAGPKRLRTMAAFVAGVVLGIAVLAIYQAWAFGSLYKPSQNYMTPTPPTSQGYRGFDWPSFALFWANFCDPRFGLFTYCPALLLALWAPFVRGVPYSLPRRELRILLAYFSLFVLFCAANQYSWLQPLTGFRYLVPVVPALALMAMQTAQALPRGVRWLVAAAACIQSMVIAAGHQNDVRAEVSALWERRFQLLWMIRLREAGLPNVWVWILAGLALAAAAWITVWVAATFRDSAEWESNIPQPVAVNSPCQRHAGIEANRQA